MIGAEYYIQRQAHDKYCVAKFNQSKEPELFLYVQRSTRSGKWVVYGPYHTSHDQNHKLIRLVQQHIADGHPCRCYIETADNTYNEVTFNLPTNKELCNGLSKRIPRRQAHPKDTTRRSMERRRQG